MKSPLAELNMRYFNSANGLYSILFKADDIMRGYITCLFILKFTIFVA